MAKAGISNACQEKNGKTHKDCWAISCTCDCHIKEDEEDFTGDYR